MLGIELKIFIWNMNISVKCKYFGRENALEGWMKYILGNERKKWNIFVDT